MNIFKVHRQKMNFLKFREKNEFHAKFRNKINSLT